MTATATGQAMITSETVQLVTRGECEHLAFIAFPGFEGALYGDPPRRISVGDIVYLVPGCAHNCRLVQSGLLRLSPPKAPPVDPVKAAAEKYYRETIVPLAMKKLQLQQAVDNANDEILAIQARQQEARAELMEVSSQLATVMKTAPK
jgi:hypothetical protein